MTHSRFEASQAYAKQLDTVDPLRNCRDQFFIPKGPQGEPSIYFVGNSLGLQPKKAREYIDRELDDWATLGVSGHLHAKTPWYSYHECLAETTARLVGAKPLEVVVMNSLTVNLHLMMISFYRPTKTRYKIVIEGGAFPSDQYAVASQAKLHGLSPKDVIVEWVPRAGEHTLNLEDLWHILDRDGDEIALVLLGDVNYLSGQAFPLQEIAARTHAKGAVFGVDLAHGAGNLHLELHDWNVDFAVWCSYKYLNAGPGAIAGCFVHERHAKAFDLPRLTGWWGHDKKARFLMGSEFKAIPGAEGWQVSNPQIFQMAALRASMEIFDDIGMAAIRMKSDKLTAFLEFLLGELPGRPFPVVTPSAPAERGSHLSLNVGKNGKALAEALRLEGVLCDFREPFILRVAPVALYNQFQDVYRFVEALSRHARK